MQNWKSSDDKAVTLVLILTNSDNIDTLLTKLWSLREVPNDKSTFPTSQRWSRQVMSSMNTDSCPPRGVAASTCSVITSQVIKSFLPFLPLCSSHQSYQSWFQMGWIVPNGKNRDLFQISFSTFWFAELKCIEYWFQKVPNSSYLVTIWPYFGQTLTSEFCDFVPVLKNYVKIIFQNINSYLKRLLILLIYHFL